MQLKIKEAVQAVSQVSWKKTRLTGRKQDKKNKGPSNHKSELQLSSQVEIIPCILKVLTGRTFISLGPFACPSSEGKIGTLYPLD